MRKVSYQEHDFWQRTLKEIGKSPDLFSVNGTAAILLALFLVGLLHCVKTDDAAPDARFCVCACMVSRWVADHYHDSIAVVKSSVYSDADTFTSLEISLPRDGVPYLAHFEKERAEYPVHTYATHRTPLPDGVLKCVKLASA